MRDLQRYLSPLAAHLLDWFHITMCSTGLRQQLKEVRRATHEQELEQLNDGALEQVKWFLWHGNVFRALHVMEHMQWDLEDLDEAVPASRKLAKKVVEFSGSIKANKRFIPSYGDRHRYGAVIATAFVESTVNHVVSKRFVKQQQMRWAKRRAHLLRPGAERGSAAKLRALVSCDDQHQSFTCPGGVVAPGLE